MIDKTKILKAQKYALEKNGICLSTEYIGVCEKLECKCANNNHPSWLASYSNILNNGNWCPICAIERNSEKRKNKHELDAKEYALEKGGLC